MIKIGILGFGYMGKQHYNFITREKNMEVIAIHDIDIAKEQEANKLNIKFYKNKKDFIEDSSINLVIICTPNQFHKNYSIECMKSGKHVICEKPVTLNCSEFEEILKVSKEYNRKFIVHQNRRWDKDFLLVKEIINQNLLGNVLSIESRIQGQRGIVFGWRAFKDSGGGMIYDWCIHQIDQILMLFPKNNVISVYALSKNVHTVQVEDYYKITLLLDNNIIINLECGIFALQKLPRWYIYGDKGTFMLDDFNVENAKLSRIHKDAVIDINSSTDSHISTSRTMQPLTPNQIYNYPLPEINDNTNFYTYIADYIDGKITSPVENTTIIKDMKIIDAIFLSIKEKKIIYL